MEIRNTYYNGQEKPDIAIDLMRRDIDVNLQDVNGNIAVVMLEISGIVVLSRNMVQCRRK